jgi:hypothetical protein
MSWLGDVEIDLKNMKVKEWKETIRDRAQWRLAVGAKALSGL